MERQINKTKLYAGTVTILLFAAITTAGMLFDVKGDLQLDLNNSQLKNEKLLSEKLQLDREISQLKGEMITLTSHSSELNSRLETANGRIVEQEKNINQIRKQNNSMKKELDAMRKLKAQLEIEVDNLKAANQALTTANKQLEKDMNGLVAENSALKDKLKNAAVLKASNFRVEVMRKRQDKLTVKASRTHQVSVSFDLPESAMASLGKSKVYMVISGPNGKTMTEVGATKKTIYADGLKMEFTPTLTKEVDLGRGHQRITIAYHPENEMSEGLYKVELYTDNLFLGNSQFRLMK